MPYIFIDESGQFSQKSNETYFVVAAFAVTDHHFSSKRLRSYYNKYFPKKMKSQAEIKFSEFKIDKKLKLKTLQFIAGLGVDIRYCYLLKQNIPIRYWSKGKLQSGLLYTSIVSELVEMFLPINDFKFLVFCDQRHLSGMKRTEFKDLLLARLLPKLSDKILIQVEMLDSINNINIQMADWIVGAIAAYLENKPGGIDYYNVLKNNIYNHGRELFKNKNPNHLD